jgi:hypothetical protein
VYAKFLSENLKGRTTRKNILMDFREQGRKVWTECIWLRIGTSGGLL